MFLQEIGGVEFSAGGGALGFAPFAVSCCEESFEAGPNVLLCGKTFTGFAVFYKETGLVHKLEINADDLFEAVGSVTGGGVITAFFDPVKKRDSIGWVIS